MKDTLQAKGSVATSGEDRGSVSHTRLSQLAQIIWTYVRGVSVLAPHGFVVNVQERLGNGSDTGGGGCRFCGTCLDSQLEHGVLKPRGPGFYATQWSVSQYLEDHLFFVFNGSRRGFTTTFIDAKQLFRVCLVVLHEHVQMPCIRGPEPDLFLHVTLGMLISAPEAARPFGYRATRVDNKTRSPDKHFLL